MCEIKLSFQNTSNCSNPTIIDGVTPELVVIWRWLSLMNHWAPTTRGHLIPLNSNQWQWNSGRWFSTSLTVSLSNLVEIGWVGAEILEKAVFCVLCPFHFLSHFTSSTSLAWWQVRLVLLWRRWQHDALIMMQSPAVSIPLPFLWLNDIGICRHANSKRHWPGERLEALPPATTINDEIPTPTS